jgi:4-hydroxy-3-polyprenylbenzoate decarboxylase
VTLGEWTDDWERFARRAVAGDWQENGRETLLRQETGRTPESPVRPGQSDLS